MSSSLWIVLSDLLFKGVLICSRDGLLAGLPTGASKTSLGEISSKGKKSFEKNNKIFKTRLNRKERNGTVQNIIILDAMKKNKNW